ncbi:LPS assembly lipoprotein LptE [Vibrio ruber]|uniref:LPS-assembly lipoprotein LptE n=1 Tax=Vibrio ruber (strain DSM 16370 / JCM 11486 / BCRC 17186 / CECT 7878 / LMG 23124 / VR1) TaxID=1123498 RepID=A0A1R4LAP0_VIBR1|nr:LPS assembly lipoprotein LptE [Vibrio ruber]WNJ95800.1 LPS assembly lipoprotein LptE [Vibrio ruber]SJN53324.1 LPS-assembly lipoprotein LptE precursor [Vibrio ruber DSM 16370]
MRSLHPSLLRHIFLTLLTVSLTACGFHLRGDYDVPEALDKLSVTSYDQYSQFTRMVKNRLRLNEIEIVEPAEDIPNLHLVSETISSRTLSIYQNTIAAEKELTLNATFRVTVPEVGTKTFTTTVTRSYLDNPLTALAKSMESSMLIDEMRQLASSQIIRLMARLKPDLTLSERSERSRNMSKQSDHSNSHVSTTEVATEQHTISQ